MNYLILNESWSKDKNMPQFIAYSQPISTLPLSWFQASDLVFYFDKNGHTIYYKSRLFDEHQYSDEEKVVLKLKSVLI